ncbi:MAG TPA: tetratricopeptide repeat protein [Candidatus Limnocylindrales bacterium]|nr:tetratricopeptide repeat protein [Candidatus Limnocylindrales bacterium]
MGAGVIPSKSEMRERELLERLGLDERASAEDVSKTRNELQAFLASAPRSLRGWARRQASAADEAYVLLSDPTAWRDAGALPAPRPRSASQPDGPATPPVRRATPAPQPAAPAVASEGDDDAAFDAMLAEVTPSMHRDRIASRPAAAVPSARAARMKVQPAVPASPGRLSRPLIGLAAAVGVVAIAVGVYQFGAPAAASTPTGSPGPAATAGLDQARVAALMARIQQDPNDTAALLELGDSFFQAGQYATAVTWLEKLVTLEPNNVRARLALGAAKFNLNEVDAAEAQWLEVLEIDADNVEAHYDLGFLYLNQTPPDYAAVQREWAEVVRLAPDTEIATVVQQHLDALAAMSPAPSGDASPATSPAASGAASAAPSPASTAAPTAAPSGSTAP